MDFQQITSALNNMVATPYLLVLTDEWTFKNKNKQINNNWDLYNYLLAK